MSASKGPSGGGERVRREYIGKSPVVQWAVFHLKRQTHLGSDLLFNIHDYSTNNLKKDFEKLKHILCICPEQRSQQDLRQVQSYLKKNHTFQCLPIKTQLQLCKAVVYQKYEAGTIIIRQRHVPNECYLVLSGKLEVLLGDADLKAQTFTSEMLYEAEEGDFIGDFDSTLADALFKQYHGTCNFLRTLKDHENFCPVVLFLLGLNLTVT
ncbi:PREDICTED: uncharacterized protein LOC109321855 [Crocodylus porosus]|uniref:uncharacterized protein LOC109321855 n=1 Tax=Crocodylus porosus TaxID=8502 RepID=UPI00093DD5A4|nr:PREDICTED: uncharacterized protein LOC109321855 [Crocodylus porosus]